jgi:hypothetical protein
MNGIENFKPVQRPVEKTEIKYIQANSIADLEEKVNKCLQQGWRLYEGLIIGRKPTCQVMVKKVRRD